MDGAIFHAFVESKDLVKKDLATELGMSKQNLFQLFKSKDFEPETIIKIENRFKKKWEAIKKEVNIDLNSEALGQVLTDVETTYLTRRRNLKNGNESPVPMYGSFSTLGNIEVFDDDKNRHKVVAQLPSEVFPGCDFAEKAKGQSMYPYIMNQAVLVGKTCTMDGIVYGEIYTIKTKSGMDTTKYVHPAKQKGYVKLVAYNKNVPDQEVLIDNVIFAYRVHFIINPT